MRELHTLNSIPAREMADMTACPTAYRRTFSPRLDMEPSPLEQPRLDVGIDEEPYLLPHVSNLVRMLVFGLVAELVMGLLICAFVVLRHQY